MKTKYLLCLLALPLGCSVLNSFDDVAAIQADASGGTSNSGGSDQGGAGGSQTGGDAGSSSGGGSGGGAVTFSDGLIVVQGVDPTDATKLYLSAIDPETGEELKREDGNYPSIAYEAKRKIWFVLKSSTQLKTPTPNEQFTLEARSFDRETNEWTILSTGTTVTVPAPLDNYTVYALAERLVILTYVDPTDTTLGAAMLVYDTSDLANIEQDGTPEPIGSLEEFKGAVVSPLPIGGKLNVYSRATAANCVGGVCDVKLSLFQVLAEGVNPGASGVVGTVASDASVGATYNYGDGQVLLAFPHSDNATGHLQQYDPQSHDTDDVQFEFGTDENQPAIAFDPCDRVAYITGPAGGSITAVPLEEGALAKNFLIGHNGQKLFFEPYTRSIIAPLEASADFKMTAFEINGDSTTPNLKKRVSGWTPVTVKPHTVAVATPAEALCD